MKIHKLNTLARRTSLVGASLALVAAVVVPSVSVFASALNPLTERSLLLSSSAPGWQNTDGSGNSYDNLNAIGESYAPPGSGPNGQKTGQTFSFRVSTDSVADDRPIQAFTLQYCTSAAGNCQAPGNNRGDARDGVASSAYPNGSPYNDGRETNAQAFEYSRSDLDTSSFNEADEEGNFSVVVEGQSPSTGWEIATANAEDSTHSGNLTGKHNLITLTHPTGISPAANDKVTITFTASDDHYITNPGADEFFVKINTYDSNNTAHHIPAVPVGTTNPNIIDGGVTVANVMTDSIHITTKVLETMSFSVGVHNRDQVELTGEGLRHGTCDAIERHPTTPENTEKNISNTNRLLLGNPDAEYSLETGKAYDVSSFWRLSSNSSAGATVYYSGDTLQNTVGDSITAIREDAPNTAALSRPGTEQFGLAFIGIQEEELSSTFLDAVEDDTTDRMKNPVLTPLVPVASYNLGEGDINEERDEEGEIITPITASFAFNRASLTVPQLIAENSDQVISCATGKMRYVANIGADTPAGVYTTKINYLAAPQY